MSKKISTALESGIIYRLETFFTYLAAAAIALMALATTADVILRMAVNMPLPGLMEFIEEWLMIGAIYLPCSYVYVKGGHIKVELFEQYFPPLMKKICNLLGCIIGFAMFALLMYGMIPRTMTAFTRPVLTDSSLGYNMGPCYAMVVIGAALMCLRTAQLFCLYLKRWNDPAEEEEKK